MKYFAYDRLRPGREYNRGFSARSYNLVLPPLNFRNKNQICVPCPGSQEPAHDSLYRQGIFLLIQTSILFLRANQPRNQWRIRVSFLGFRVDRASKSHAPTSCAWQWSNGPHFHSSMCLHNVYWQNFTFTCKAYCVAVRSASRMRSKRLREPPTSTCPRS